MPLNFGYIKYSPKFKDALRKVYIIRESIYFLWILSTAFTYDNIFLECFSTKSTKHIFLNYADILI